MPLQGAETAAVGPRHTASAHPAAPAPQPPPHKPCFIGEVATWPTPPSQEDELFPAEPQCADSDPV